MKINFQVQKQGVIIYPSIKRPVEGDFVLIFKKKKKK